VRDKNLCPLTRDATDGDTWGSCFHGSGVGEAFILMHPFEVAPDWMKSIFVDAKVVSMFETSSSVVIFTKVEEECSTTQSADNCEPCKR